MIREKEQEVWYPGIVMGSRLHMGEEFVTVMPDASNGSIFEKDGKRYRRSLATFIVNPEYLKLELERKDGDD